VIADVTTKGYWRRLHAVLVEKASVPVGDVPSAGDLPVTANEHDTSEESRITHLFLSIYDELLIAGAQQQRSVFDKWRQSLDQDTWAHKAYAAVGQMGFDHGSYLAASDSSLEKPLAALADVPPFLFPEHRDWWGISKAYRKALIEICSAFASLRLVRKGISVDTQLLEELRSLSELKGSYGVTEVLLKLKPAVLVGTGVTGFLEQDAKEWADKIETFSERAQHYVELATIAYRKGDHEVCKRLLRTTISNALGYGYHKDMSIYLDIESISECRKAGSTKAREWLLRIAPIAKQAGKFTDGDETGNLLLQVAEACETACPDVLHSMYVGLCTEEELYWAEEVFANILRVANLSDPFQAALAATSVDQTSQSVLEARAKNGETEAKAIWNLVQLPTSPIPLVGFNTPSTETQSLELNGDDQVEVEPEQVAEYLNKLSPPYEQHKFSRSWFSTQVKAGNAEAAYKALRDWMRERDYYVVDHELLFEMVPFAEEFDGREEGFQCLCMAATQSYAWSRFAYGPKERRKIWSELQKRYPDKWVSSVTVPTLGIISHRVAIFITVVTRRLH
jgi:hypothetical protein